MKLSCDPAAIRVGHHDIQQNQIRLELVRDLENMDGFIFRAHLKKLRRFQVEFEASGNTGFVVHHQNPFLIHASLSKMFLYGFLQHAEVDRLGQKRLRSLDYFVTVRLLVGHNRL